MVSLSGGVQVCVTIDPSLVSQLEDIAVNMDTPVIRSVLDIYMRCVPHQKRSKRTKKPNLGD